MADLLVAVTCVAGGAIAVLAAIEDLRTRRLRNRLTLALAVIAIVGFTVASLVDGEFPPVGQLLLGSVLFGGPWLVMHVIRPAGIGFGDVKLTAGLGLYLGWFDPALSLYALVLASLLFVAVVFARRGDRTETQPFGPALVAGAIVVATVWLLL